MSTIGKQNASGADFSSTIPFTFVSEIVVPWDYSKKKRPSVTVIDSAGTECKGKVIYEQGLGQIKVHFSAPFTGTLYLN